MATLEEQRDFKGVWIPREVYLDKRINALEKLILIEIDSLSKKDKGCFASNRHFAEHCQCSEKKISMAVAKLEKLGYIETKITNGKSREIVSHMDRPLTPMRDDETTLEKSSSTLEKSSSTLEKNSTPP